MDVRVWWVHPCADWQPLSLSYNGVSIFPRHWKSPLSTGSAAGFYVLGGNVSRNVELKCYQMRALLPLLKWLIKSSNHLVLMLFVWPSYLTWSWGHFYFDAYLNVFITRKISSDLSHFHVGWRLNKVLLVKHRNVDVWITFISKTLKTSSRSVSSSGAILPSWCTQIYIYVSVRFWGII